MLYIDTKSFRFIYRIRNGKVEHCVNDDVGWRPTIVYRPFYQWPSGKRETFKVALKRFKDKLGDGIVPLV